VESRECDIVTQVVHAGERQQPPTGMPVATPIYASATFTYPSMAEMDRVFSGEKADVFTSVLHPATASHREMPPARRRQVGIGDGLIRMSVGIEDPQDVLADIGQALEAATPDDGTA